MISLTLLGHVAVEVLLRPEAGEQVLGHVLLGLLHDCDSDWSLKLLEHLS